MTSLFARLTRSGGCVRGVWLCLVALVAACNSSAAVQQPADTTLGSIAVALDLPSGTTITQVSYSISGGALLQPRTGSIDVSAPAGAITAAVGGIPAATGYVLTLTAAASDGAACLGSAQFAVLAGQTTTVPATLACRATRHDGTLVLNALTINQCPTIDSLVAMPLAAAEGNQINLSAMVSDPDGNMVSLAWTATAGTIASPGAAMTTYSCVTGSQILSLRIDDGHGCQQTASVQVLCTPLTCTACDPLATCRNVGGQATCVCGAGYHGNGTTCADLDECALHTSNCSAQATCTNSVGSFTCACNAGYQGDGVSCLDIDECATHINNCSAQATCTNTPGSFSCACNTGYQGNGVSCTDIDECATHTSNCSAQASCTNTVGSFSCACNTGYQGNGVSCADVDECANGANNCSVQANCTNTPGSFSCACKSGYQGNGVSCTDVDECANGTAHCGVGSCTNTQGAFVCNCPAGYSFDGTTCADIDECANGTNNCGSSAVCDNTVGSFYCLSKALFRASVSSSGGDPNGQSMRPVFSADGRYVAYDSVAGNIVSGDTNGKLDVFVLDRVTGVTTRASVSSSGVQGDNASLNPSLSRDGRYVAFHSTATNLVSGDTNAAADVFVHDMTTGTTVRASLSTSAAEATGGDSTFPVLSGDGHLVVFQSLATNLVSGDTNAQQDVFVRDLVAGTTTRASVSTFAAQADQLCSEQTISADGRFVAFSTFASTLVVGDNNSFTDVFVRDLSAGTTTRVSVSSAGAQATQASFHPALSQDGRYVAFTSNASNLVTGDAAGFRDVFVRDRNTNITTRESVSSSGVEANNASTLESISADGRYLAFSSLASNLYTSDINGFEDVFVRDRSSGTTALVSMSSAGTRGNNPSTQPTISADAHFVGFYSQASNLVAGDTNGVQDIFVSSNPLIP